MISEYSEANPRRSSSSSNFEPSGNVSYHYLGGRDHDDPMTNLLVTKSDKGWHCPDCIHIATTKGNLKSHIMSGRHKLMEKSFQCRFCKRHYSTRQSMQVHISTNHRQERDLEMGIKMQNPAMEIQNENMFETSANNPEVEIQGNFD